MIFIALDLRLTVSAGGRNIVIINTQTRLKKQIFFPSAQDLEECYDFIPVATATVPNSYENVEEYVKLWTGIINGIYIIFIGKLFWLVKFINLVLCKKCLFFALGCWHRMQCSFRVNIFFESDWIGKNDMRDSQTKFWCLILACFKQTVFWGNVLSHPTY